MRRIVIFGIGKKWKENKCCLGRDDEVVVFLDNKSEGKCIDGISVVTPANIHKYKYDYIVLMSPRFGDEMRQQLLDLEVDMECVYSWDEYVFHILKDECICFNDSNNKQAEIAIFSSGLDYTGAPMTVLYAAKVLVNKGYSVEICTNACDERLLDEINQSGIKLMVAPAFPRYVCSELKKTLESARVIMANTILTLPAVMNMQGKKPIMWWIHEAMDAYTMLTEKECETKFLCDEFNIKAVSKIALHNFNAFFGVNIQDIMPYGIPDERMEKKEHTKIIFALVGTVSERKAQDIYVKAIGLLPDNERAKCEFWMIGQKTANSYTREIEEEVRKIKQIKWMGTLTRKEIKEIYKMVDVVVCPSREDPLPIVMTEAMMWEKACITSDMTGTADYIVDGYNGFVCEVEDAEGLSRQMSYLINNNEAIEKVGRKGRKLYEENWTIDKFGDRLEWNLKETIEKFYTIH